LSLFRWRKAIDGKLLIKYLAIIAAWVGEKNLAGEQLALANRPPSAVRYGGLNLVPFWDLLRSKPCFEKNRRVPRAEVIAL
jgi:hypothetical protein